MRHNEMKRSKWRLSIPFKIILMGGMTYILTWIVWQALWRMQVLDPTGSIMGLSMVTAYHLGSLILVTLIASAGTYYYHERPLTSLQKALIKAEQGDFLTRSPIFGDDELGEASRAFNRLMAKLTDVSATNIQMEQDVLMAQEQDRLRRKIEEKTAIIERTNRTLEMLVKDLSLVHEIGQEINSTIDLNRLYGTIALALKKHLRIHEFALLVFDEKQEELQVKAAYGFTNADALSRMSFRKGEGITGLAAETGRKIYIKDTSRETRFLNYKGERPPEASSFLSIPLVYKDEVVGVANFGRHGVGSFTYQDVKMLSLAGSQIALAIANARLYTRTRELTVKDELTGINNRRHFQSMLQMEWKRAVRFHRALSLIMIDVDHFKKYNDTFGHLQGDQVLKQIGEILRRNLREVDTVARFGGEEFILLLPDTDKHGAMAVAEKVRALIEAHRFAMTDQQKTRTVTISAGIATYPDDLEEMDDLINDADIALYRAKELGRNRIECYQDPVSENASQGSDLEMALMSEKVRDQRRKRV